ncbi:MAG: ATP-binding protein [bacterium]|nr:ATP-binding protein [bacterium]
MQDPNIARIVAERAKQLEAMRDAVRAYEQAAETLQKLSAQNGQALESLRRNLAAQETAFSSDKLEAERYDREIAEMQEQISTDENANGYKVALALTLANAAYDVLMVLDRDFRIIAINNAAEVLFERQRPIGEHLVSVTNIPQLLSIVEDALINEEESLEEQISIDKRAFRVKVQVIRREGNDFIGVAMEDISDLVRLARARRDMVANISHELRTPITNIKLTIESLFHEQDRPKRKQSASALKAIAREVDSMQWLVQGMHDLSMIESGEAILRMYEFPLYEMVADTLERMSDLSESKEVIVQSDVAQDIQVLADRDLTMRVLINLIHNALKWSPPHQVIQVSAIANGDQVLISVSDKGPGVPEEHRERIFERFYQVDPARSRSEGSSGLGLAISKHIIEAHEGQIWVESAANGGAMFCFTLPNASVLHQNPE